MIELWFAEAERHGVFPLDDRTIQLFASRTDDRSPHPTSRHYHYRPPMTPLPTAVAPSPGGRGWELSAQVTRSAGDEGVIWATGSANSGLSVFVQNDRLVIDYNAFDDHTVVESNIEVPTGETRLGARLTRTGRSTGTVELLIDGEAVGSAELEFMMRMISSLGASLGHDHGSPVSPRYDGPFPFSGTLHEVEIQSASRPKPDAADTGATARTEMSRQ